MNVIHVEIFARVAASFLQTLDWLSSCLAHLIKIQDLQTKNTQKEVESPANTYQDDVIRKSGVRRYHEKHLDHPSVVGVTIQL